MLSKRNLIMMLTMIFVVLTLFLSSVVLKEYFNDYGINHMAQTELIEKKESTSVTVSDIEKAQFLYFGSENNGYYSVIEEWATYRKKAFAAFSTFEGLEEITKSKGKKLELLLVDGQMLYANTDKYTQMLTEYVQKGGIVIFYRMPSYNTIKNSVVLRNLLGIQRMRSEKVKLKEIRLFSGFLLGGETHYSFENVTNPDLIDMESEIPWYDISSRTKTYMVGFLTEEEKASKGLHNEDMPAIIWRSNMDKGSVFAVNGDYIKTAGLGILDAMLYEAKEYSLYPVVNAQNLCIAGFPSLTNENEDKMAEVYGMNTEQFCRDILWPSFVAATNKNGWKITSFVSVKQSDSTKVKPKTSNLVEYLKYFNEESAEAGASIGRIRSTNILRSVRDEKTELKNLNIGYLFTCGYIRQENKRQLKYLINYDGSMNYFNSIRTIVGEYDESERVLSYLTDKIIYQRTTTDAYRHSYSDSLKLKSIETALGYSNVQVDIYRVLWPENEKDQWEYLAEKMASNIDTYWKPFSVFDKTTVTQSDTRVRNFLNGSVQSSKDGDTVTIKTENFTSEAYLLFRTHGERFESMTGGTYKQVEKDAYLLTLTSDTAEITLNSKVELYYK
ncbi:MAG: DUF2194 domain-containing protein [Clostridia bacterium]